MNDTVNAVTNNQLTDKIVDETIENEVYMEDGVIIKPEKRGIIQKMKTWYYKHIIETGKSAKWEERTDKSYKFMKKLIAIAGPVASLILLAVPGGQLAAGATILATPGLLALLSLEKELERKILITLKRKSEEAMGFGKDGYSPNVTDADITLNEVVEGATKIVKESPEVIKDIPQSNSISYDNIDLEPAVASRGMR